mmetsp:Transcript_59739/g.146581  ORF Transcript_59739/g.146581 Transcript_59739/m.146581 type:complete len:875 (+) Transcript_59739:406-3030(+)|eukprot:CAMPEP_0113452282 /NCGR_PEP_ID=MMETSP0014_2-20120614/6767_1 /TAXON_ID=2857 /ORGANISM="Nitzschia sp." /LENGTH=874 /DNA_ID=CAMNT_0000343651 /DNA_START=370 /DNA_END=2994 /DNA_ORIENTATION=+ /assembly_acc=CAM_ASM_000159
MMVNLSKKRRTSSSSSRQCVLCGLVINLLLLLFVVVNIVNVDVVDAQQQQGFQHHFDGTSYAGGMAYDTSHNVVYVTGQVGEDQCFVGVIKHNVDGDSNDQQFQFLSRHVFEEQAICQSLVVTKPGQGQQINVEEHGGGTALLLSTMEEGGLLTSRRPVGSDHSTLYGGMVEFHVDGIGQNAVYDPTGSILMHQDLVQIPQSIITGSTATSSKTFNRVFVASLMTENTKPTTEYESWESPAVPPNFTPSGKFHKYGGGGGGGSSGGGGGSKKYSMSISMIHLKTDFSHAQLGWTKPYGTVPATATTTTTTTATTASGNNSTEEEEEEGIPIIDSSAYVKQLLLHGRETLFVVGSTRGTGPAFGGGGVDTGGSTGSTDSDIGDDSTSTIPLGAMSGFITKLNPETGSLIDTPSLDTVASKRFHLNHSPSSIDANNNSNTTTSSSSSSRGDTYIEAICAAPRDETKDTLGTVEDAVYVVGSYEQPSSAVNGDGSVGNYNAGMVSVPFVAKLYASSLETIWRSEFPATTNARALSCGVDDTSGVVYVAGVVDDGGEIMGQTQTKLRDDVFVVQVSKHNGSLAWIRQVGTSGHDHLAHGGSSSMVVLNDGAGVLVFGDTTGNMFSEVSQTHEVFVAHIDADGNTPDTNELSGIQSTGGGDKLPIIHPVQAGNDDTATDSGGPNVDDNNGKPRPPLEAPAPNNNQPQQPSQTQSGVFYKVLAAFTVLGVLALAVIGTRRRREEERSTERALVFSYLQEFDIEDIDVRHSATGGWHGTYVNNLARGVISRGVEDGVSEVGSDGSGPSSTYSHSSIVRDSLFMDNVDSTTPSYGHDGDNDEVENEQDQSGVPYRDDPEFDDDDVEESLARIAEGPSDKEIV